jgi:hypothetical protein
MTSKPDMALKYRLRMVLLASILLFDAPSPVYASTISDWLWNSPYHTSNLKEELQCFALPYGGIGFASHILTYYTIIMLAYHRSPVFFKLNTFWRFDIALATFSLISTIIITTLTTIRCRNRWEFICLTVWKLDLSLTLGSVAIHSATSVANGIRAAPYEFYEFKRTRDLSGLRRELSGKVYSYAGWLFLYLPGIGAGLAGLFSIVHKVVGTNTRVRIITIVFGVIWGLPAGLGLLACGLHCCGRHNTMEKGGCFKKALVGLAVSVFLIFILLPFYCDWVLGAIGEDLTGLPSSDNAILYWLYFAAKRIPGFSF